MHIGRGARLRNHQLGLPLGSDQKIKLHIREINARAQRPWFVDLKTIYDSKHPLWEPTATRLRALRSADWARRTSVDIKNYDVIHRSARNWHSGSVAAMILGIRSDKQAPHARKQFMTADRCWSQFFASGLPGFPELFRAFRRFSVHRTVGICRYLSPWCDDVTENVHRLRTSAG